MRHDEPTHAHPSSLLLLGAIGVLVALLLDASTAHAAKLHPDRTCRAPSLTATKAINCYWPAHSRARALRIAECESTASAPERIARRRGLGRWARDYATGTHWGIFQLGRAERRRYGDYQLGAPARVQVWSAIRLYRHRGWSPWVCR